MKINLISRSKIFRLRTKVRIQWHKKIKISTRMSTLRINKTSIKMRIIMIRVSKIITIMKNQKTQKMQINLMTTQDRTNNNTSMSKKKMATKASKSKISNKTTTKRTASSIPPLAPTNNRTTNKAIKPPIIVSKSKKLQKPIKAAKCQVPSLCTSNKISKSLVNLLKSYLTMSKRETWNP